jgi:hypothetical protein
VEGELIWPRCRGEGEEEGEEERKVKSMAGPHFMPRFGRVGESAARTPPRLPCLLKIAWRSCIGRSFTACLVDSMVEGTRASNEMAIFLLGWIRWGWLGIAFYCVWFKGGEWMTRCGHLFN